MFDFSQYEASFSENVLTVIESLTIEHSHLVESNSVFDECSDIRNDVKLSSCRLNCNEVCPRDNPILNFSITLKRK